MMSRPSLNELFARWQNDVSARLSGASTTLRRSLLRVLGAALAGAHHALYGALLEAARQSNPATATGTSLDQWATLWLPGGRRVATAASGVVDVTGTPGATVPSGAVLQDVGGAEFTVGNGVVLDATGEASVVATASLPGAAGNQAADVVLSFVSPPAGVDAQAQVGPSGFAGGADVESDDDLRERLIQRIQSPPHGGNAADYEFWARSIAGVDRVWVFPLYSGLGTVRVYIAETGYSAAETHAASLALVDEVQTYIDSVRPVTAAVDSGGVFVSGVTVAAPERQPVNITLTAGPDSPELRAAIEAALTALFERDAVPEGTVLLSRLREAVSQATGEDDNSIISPVANVTAEAGKILVRGAVLWPS